MLIAVLINSRCSLHYIQTPGQRWKGLETSGIIGSNSSYLEQLLQWIKGTAVEGAQWKRCFHAKDDGFEASTFHKYCDNKQITLTIVQSGDYIFGGFSDQPWNAPADGK